MWWKKYVKVVIILIVTGLVAFGIYSLSRVIVDNTYSSREIVEESNKQNTSSQDSDTEGDTSRSEIESSDNSSTETESDTGTLSDSEEYKLEDYQSSTQQKVRSDGDLDNFAYSKNEYLLRLSSILNKDESPYHKDYNEYIATAEDLQDGDKIVNIIYKDNIILSVYCNSIDYAPYMFTKNSPFSDEENQFFSSLGNGESGKEDGVYYWRYM